jgi:hypothetical protein
MLLNLAKGTPTSPFTVSGNQTFINSAFIQDGTITNAKIGNVIQSTALANNGTPIWTLDKGGRWTVVDQAGTVRVEMGMLST